MKQERILIVPVLQVGKLRHRPLKFQQSSKKRAGELEKDPERGLQGKLISHSPHLPTRGILPEQVCSCDERLFSKPDFSGALCEEFLIYLPRGNGSS